MFRVLIFNTDESRFETRMKFLRDLDCLNYFAYVSTKGKTLRAFMFRTRKPIIPSYLLSRTVFNNAQGVSMFIEKQEEDVSSFLVVLIKIAEGGGGSHPCKEVDGERKRERLKLSKMEITIIKMER